MEPELYPPKDCYISSVPQNYWTIEFRYNKKFSDVGLPFPKLVRIISLQTNCPETFIFTKMRYFQETLFVVLSYKNSKKYSSFGELLNLGCLIYYYYIIIYKTYLFLTSYILLLHYFLDFFIFLIILYSIYYRYIKAMKSVRYLGGGQCSCIKSKIRLLILKTAG